MHRLKSFVKSFASLCADVRDESILVRDGRVLLGELVAHDDWLPDPFGQADPQHYRQYLLHCDSAERFSVVSFVWGPGQTTPIHDHTIWGLIGMLRGGELSERFAASADGTLRSAGAPQMLNPGEVDAVSPSIGDIHRVSNAYGDRVSISIHVYGADIGSVQRHTYATDGTRKNFVSGYSNTVLPNVWGDR